MKVPVNRIRELRKSRGWNQAELAERAGLQSIGHVSNLETGKRTSAAAFMAIARALEVPVEELGIGQTRKSSLSQTNFAVMAQPHYKLPVRARVIGGPADEAVEYYDEPSDWEWSDEGPRDNCEVLEIFGDSMEPLFKEGDRLVVKRSETPIDGDVVVAEFHPDCDVERLTTIKIFRKQSGVVSLEPLNKKKYRTIVMDERWAITAVMVKHIRRNVRGFHKKA